MTERRERPAVAYYTVVLALVKLGLFDRYFAAPPPREGVRVFVQGKADGITTQWDMDVMIAKRLVPRLRRSREIASIRTTTYDRGPTC